MRKNVTLLIIPLITGLCHVAFGHKSNPYLAYTMKVIARDAAAVAEPTKKPNPADVTDGMILTGIIRARTSMSQLQLIIDRAGKFEGGQIVKDELTPDLNDETPDKQKELMELYPQLLKKAKTKLELAETQLKTQLAIENPEARDFSPLKTTLTELDAIITEAHKLFRPE